MNGKAILDMMGDLDPCIVLDAEPDIENRKKTVNLRIVGAVAAGVLVFSCVGIGIRQIAKAKKTAYTVYPGNSEWSLPSPEGSRESSMTPCSETSLGRSPLHTGRSLSRGDNHVINQTASNEVQAQQGHQAEPPCPRLGYDQNEQTVPAPPQEKVLAHQQTEGVRDLNE